MAIFLLMGVGVDDVFVFLDTYKSVARHDARMNDDLWARMSATMRHAGVAMGVTSLTTSVSFFMNATSSFYGIAGFGCFAACLVIVNYISMITFFPTVVAFNHHKYRERKFLCGIPDALSRRCSNTSPEAQERCADETSETESAMVKFFEKRFAYFILSHRIKILVIFAGISAYMFSRLPLLEAEKEEPQMLPTEHPINQYMDVMSNKFLRGGGLFNTQVELIFGFDKVPIEGADESAEGFGDADKIGALGTVSWNPNWYSDDANQLDFALVSKSFDCLVQLCNEGEKKASGRNTGGPPAYQMKGCVHRDVKRYLETVGVAGTSWAMITAGDAGAFQRALESMFADGSGQYMSNADFLEHTFAEDIGGTASWRYWTFELVLTSNKYLDAEVGLDLSENWKAWLASEMGKGSCVAVQNTLNGFINAIDFHQFQVAQNKEMSTGIMVAIIVALSVLVLVTGNIFIGFYAAFCIAMIVIWVMAMVPIQGWKLGIVENIA
eukprot:CAMPEP_0170651520 /NCGR_PEP_ID=MMETSP0224-20130122/46412_1 /TAXON_ID=285029 /ORGANISM="Togula jolla, Strain CCCM 725" /LENGTH=495 /DNA_ID=CAMNT_0010983319 /DNA_START=229 /DNA_END=1713 /DNA_ORIENTATION=-